MLTVPILKSASHEIPTVHVSPLGVVVAHKARIMNASVSEGQNKKKKGGLNACTDSDSVPLCRCAEPLTKFIVTLL